MNVEIKGLYSDVARADLKRKMDIIQAIQSITQDQVVSARETVNSTLADNLDVPYAHLQWAKKLFEAGRKDEGLEYVVSALKNARYDLNPQILYSQAIQTLVDQGFDDYADVSLKVAMERFADDVFFECQLANRMLKAGNVQDAIDILEGLFEENEGNEVIGTSLAHALTIAGRPVEASHILHDLSIEHPDDEILQTVLANALEQAYGID